MFTHSRFIDELLAEINAWARRNRVHNSTSAFLHHHANKRVLKLSEISQKEARHRRVHQKNGVPLQPNIYPSKGVHL
ncbi:MAG: hypothetical protein KME30_27270 [Iphinoe sp. HA4291-MV1]|nr:hypothetical protein [Iphinoe sp. HA4291-MV1]